MLVFTKLLILSSFNCSVSLTTKTLGLSIKKCISIITCPDCVSDVGPKGREEVEGEPVEDEKGGGGHQEYQPEPEEQIELLVDNIVGKHTDGLQTKYKY